MLDLTELLPLKDYTLFKPNEDLINLVIQEKNLNLKKRFELWKIVIERDSSSFKSYKFRLDLNGAPFLACFFPNLIDPETFPWNRDAWSIINYCPELFQKEKVSFSKICEQYHSISKDSMLELMNSYGIHKIQSPEIFGEFIKMGYCSRVYHELRENIDFDHPDIVNAILDQNAEYGFSHLKRDDRISIVTMFHDLISPVKSEELAKKVFMNLMNGLNPKIAMKLLSNFIPENFVSSNPEFLKIDFWEEISILRSYDEDTSEPLYIDDNTVFSNLKRLLEERNCLFGNGKLKRLMHTNPSKIRTLSKLNKTEAALVLSHVGVSLSEKDKSFIFSNFGGLVPQYCPELIKSRDFKWKKDAYSVLDYKEELFISSKSSFNHMCRNFGEMTKKQFIKSMSIYDIHLISEASLFHSRIDHSELLKIKSEIIDLIDFESPEIISQILSLDYQPALIPFYEKLRPVESEDLARNVILRIKQGMPSDLGLKLAAPYLDKEQVEFYKFQMIIKKLKSMEAVKPFNQMIQNSNY